MPRAILFDLFGTVVHFSTRAPISLVGGTRWLSMGWLQPLVSERLPEVEHETLVAALSETTAEIVRERPPDYFEVPSRERFRRALAKVGVAEPSLDELARDLSAVHMSYLASMTYLPEGYRDVLVRLRRRYRLGLVSNFDDADTALRILKRHAVDDCFDAILVSEGVGRRKPHPSIFELACERVGASRDDVLFVGDNPDEDIRAARACGLATAWVTSETSTESLDPDYRVRDLHELPSLLLD